jgi:hypothetical protein
MRDKKRKKIYVLSVIGEEIKKTILTLTEVVKRLLHRCCFVAFLTFREPSWDMRPDG